MEALLLDALKGLVTSSPFAGLLMYMWWSERTERREAAESRVALEKEYADKYAGLLERSIKADYEGAASINKMATMFEAQVRLIGGQRA